MNAIYKKVKSLNLFHHKSFLFTNLSILFLSLLCILPILLPNKTYTFEGTNQVFREESGINIPVYQNISLNPGLYYIQLDYSTDADGSGICLVEDANVYPGALLANYEHFYSNLSSTDFSIWLFESTDTLTVSVNLGSEGTLSVGNLTIRETNGLWTMLLTIILFLGLAANFCVVFALYRKSFSVSKQSKRVFFSILLITLMASTPFLLEGIITGADLGYHLHRIEAVSAGISAGQFPVRIAPRWLYNQGYADPIFYCNLLLLFPGILRLLGFPMSVSYQIFALAVNLATAWIAYYSFSRIFKNYKLGIFCSALYTLSQFRIFKFVINGALGEGTAQIFLPLILLGLYEVLSASGQAPRKNAWLHIAVGYAGLIQSHVLTTEITAFVTLLLCLIYLRRVLQKPVFITLAKSVLGAVLLSLWYLVPFLDYYLTQNVHIKNVSARTIQDRGLYLGELLYLFVQLPNGTDTASDGMANVLTPGCGFLLFAGLLFFFILWYGKHLPAKDKLTSFVKVSAVLSAVLLLFSLQIFPWDKLQSLHPIAASLISSLQFPNRFLGWGTCLLIFVMGYVFSYLTQHFHRTGKYLTWGIMVLALVAAGYQLDAVNKNCSRVSIYNEEAIDFGYISGAEYVIEGTDDSLLTFENPVASDNVTIASYQNENLHITAHCTNDSGEQGYVDMPLLLYKGYQAYNTDTGEPLALCYDDNNQMRVLLPPHFSGNIGIKFVSPIYWRIAEAISLITLLALLFTKTLRKGGTHEKTDK